jgi:protein O-GlcNAc transferase
LRAAGLPELITDSLEAYESLAQALATDPARLAELRGRLASQRDTAPLFDTDLTRRHIEAAYATAHERQRAGLPPAAFDVPA